MIVEEEQPICCWKFLFEEESWAQGGHEGWIRWAIPDPEISCLYVQRWNYSIQGNQTKPMAIDVGGAEYKQLQFFSVYLA